MGLVMKVGSYCAVIGLLCFATMAVAGEAEFEVCQGTSENAVIRAANCDLAIRMGGLSNEQMIVALFNRGQAALADEKPDKALEDFDAILKLAPDDTKALYTRGIARRQLKQFDGALADFDRLLTLNYQPAAKIYLNRSMVHFLTGNKEKNLADLDTASRLAPNDREITDRLWKTKRFYDQEGR